MPCVQAEERKRHEAYVAANRRDVNAFHGVTDPVQALEIIHRPRRFDPLVNWIPHPVPTDQLYTELNPADQQRLAAHAESLVGSDRHEEAQDIVRCLSAFTDTELDGCLRSMAACGKFWPSIAFRRTPAKLRDEMIAQLQDDPHNRNHILCALAWLGDATVVELFARWRKHPPAWRDSLYVPPYAYSFQAGWELSEDDQRRDLYFPKCTKLFRGASQSRGTFCAITEREDKCPWCSQNLTNLVDVAPFAFGLPTNGEADRIQVATCEFCGAYGTVFGALDASGRGSFSEANSRPEYLPDDSDDWIKLPRNSLTPAGNRPAVFAADQFLPTTFSQLGGHPTWIQDASYPSCPSCTKTMPFLAQLSHEDIEDYSEGIYYCFVCLPCGTTATSYQQT